MFSLRNAATQNLDLTRAQGLTGLAPGVAGLDDAMRALSPTEWPLSAQDNPGDAFFSSYPERYSRLVRRELSPGSARVQTDEWQGLGQALWAWADPARAARLHDRPWDLLQAVCDHYGATLAPTFVANLDPNLLEDEAWLDQAALLYAQGEEGAARAPRSLTGLRAPLLAALKAERDAYALRAALLQPPNVAAGATAIYFDGFALHNARGLTLEQIAASSALPLPANSVALSGAERLERLRARFADIGEDTQYPVGSVAHSLATTVLRIQTYQNLAPLDGLPTEAQWAQAFQALEAGWAETKNYPLHPRLLFALHLAASSGVQLMDEHWRETLWQQIEPQLRDQPATLKLARGRLQQLQRGGSDRRTALSRLFGDIASGELGRLPSLTWAQHMTLIQVALQGDTRLLRRQNAQARLQVRFAPLQNRMAPYLRHETLSGVDGVDKLQALMRYAGERLQAVFEAPPRFSRRAEAERVLSARGLSAAELRRSRPYTLITHNPNIAQEGFGSPVDEFLARADWSAFPGCTMRVGSQVLEPGALLQVAEDQFNRTLLAHPWIRAYAKEQLRGQGRVPWPEALEVEVARIVANYQTETESHRGWVRGLTTWINVVPILGPIYNIEEGIRGRDPWQAVLGTLFLALDALDLFSGEERAARGSPRLGEPEIMAQGAGEMEPLLSQRAQTVNVAMSLRRQFGAHAPEGRWLPERAPDPFFLKRSNAAAPLANRHSSPARLASMEGEMVRGTPVAERLTCTEVKRLIDAAGDDQFKDFATQFARRFTIVRYGVEPSRIDVATLFQSFYQHSSTFRRLMNRYLAGAPAGEVWRIHVGDAPSPGFGDRPQPYTDFDHKAIYVQSDQAIGGLRYMAADGFAPIRLEQAYLHEMLHAITGALDPARSLSLVNRGPVVYLTDRVLAESGQFGPPQVMYRREDALPALAAHDTVLGNCERATEAMLAEDRYLDAYLARRYRPIIANWLHESDVPGSVFLVGVGSAKLWVDHAAVSAALARRFNLLPVPAGWEARLGSSATVTHFLRHLTDRSLIFRGLLASSSADWTIAWDDVPTPQIDRVTHCVTLPRSGGAHYLHDYGRAVIEPQRQLTEALVEALSGLSRPGGLDASARRGAVLILAQQVLDQAGYHFPRRLSAAEITATAPLTWLTPARRRADAEDGFLAPALAP